MTQYRLNTPVAFIIFNRPDLTERVFKEIAKAKPPKLLVVSDGARINRDGEAEKVAASRTIIQRVDWNCEVLTNFSSVNLGCKHRVSSGIDWVFENVDEAIILEDDCLPHPTFFKFCEEMLERYRFDQQIGMINGCNFHFGKKYNNDSYYFSKYCQIWGWATWRDRWVADYDVSISQWPEVRRKGVIFENFNSKNDAAFWINLFDRTYSNEINTWDYQWFLANLLKSRLNITPCTNLISNIGFGEFATHTSSYDILMNLPTKPIIFPLAHPPNILQFYLADKHTNKICFNRGFKVKILSILLRIYSRLKFIFHK